MKVHKLLKQLRRSQLTSRLRWLVAGVTCLCLFWLLTTAVQALPFPGLPLAQSGSVTELQRQQQQIEQQRSRLTQERNRLQNLEKAAQGQLSGLRRNIQATSTQIQTTETQLGQAVQQLKRLILKLADAEKAFQQKQVATVSRLRFLQRQQISQGWAVLLQSQNLNDFLDRRRQLKLVYKADQKMLTTLKAEAEQINRQRLQVEQKKNEIALLKQQLLAQKAEFQAQAESQEQMIDRLKTDRQALEAAEAQLVRDSENIGALIRKRLAEQNVGSSVVGTGQFAYPCSAPITSSFGWRVHPILGYSRFHAGVDFGADYGTTIRAADSGVVIYAGWYGGYGNAVIIDHGSGITTLYAHASELYVSEGQGVQRGQAIAAVGSTGLSTGPHLHFEVRRNGDPVDPMAYL